MKFTLATLSLLALGAIAAPAPEPEPEPWCLRPGQGCWKVRRAAEAFQEAIHSSGGLSARSAAGDFSNQPGGAAFMAKRNLNELANLIALAQNDPESFYGQLELENQFEADDDGSDKEKRSADAEADPWCTRPGQGCWKRDASAVPEPWCTRPGQGCWKRDPKAEADFVNEDKRWCLRPGQGCWKAKRAAEAVLNAIGEADPDDLHSKPFNPAFFAKREAQPDPEPWCLRPGQGCWKAKRDILAMRSAAFDIIDSLE